MKIAQSHSHLNGEEFLLVHHKELYKEIIFVIESIDAYKLEKKKSKEARKIDRNLYSPKALNNAFKEKFRLLEWKHSTYKYYITQSRQLMTESIRIPFKKPVYPSSGGL